MTEISSRLKRPKRGERRDRGRVLSRNLWALDFLVVSLYRRAVVTIGERKNWVVIFGPLDFFVVLLSRRAIVAIGWRKLIHNLLALGLVVVFSCRCYDRMEGICGPLTPWSGRGLVVPLSHGTYYDDFVVIGLFSR